MSVTTPRRFGVALDNYFKTGDEEFFEMLEDSEEPMKDAQTALFISSQGIDNVDADKVITFAQRMVRDYSPGFFTEPMLEDAFNKRTFNEMLERIDNDSRSDSVLGILSENMATILQGVSFTKSARKRVKHKSLPP